MKFTIPTPVIHFGDEHIEKLGAFDEIRSHRDFFVSLVGNSTEAWEAFIETANRFREHVYFYSTGETVENKEGQV